MTTPGMTPYQSEATEAQPPALPAKKSTIPKVLGVIHLVIGGITMVSGLIGVFSGKSQADSYKETFAGKGMDTTLVSDGVLESLAVLDFPTTMIAGFELLASVLMVVAGIGLLKYQGWGRLITNVYASMSLLLKGVNVYVMAVIAMPFYEALIASDENMQIVGVGGMRAIVVGSIIVSAVYPVVALILVNVKSSRLSLG